MKWLIAESSEYVDDILNMTVHLIIVRLVESNYYGSNVFLYCMQVEKRKKKLPRNE